MFARPAGSAVAANFQGKALCASQTLSRKSSWPVNCRCWLVWFSWYRSRRRPRMGATRSSFSAVIPHADGLAVRQCERLGAFWSVQGRAPFRRRRGRLRWALRHGQRFRHFDPHVPVRPPRSAFLRVFRPLPRCESEARTSSSGPFSDTSFAMAIGAGIEAQIAGPLHWRIIQGNYLPTWFGNAREDNARLSTGIVIHV